MDDSRMIVPCSHCNGCHPPSTQCPEARIVQESRELSPPRFDDPYLDGTDYAHPAWWRGHEHTTGVFCQMVNEILDGKDDGKGMNHEPWHSTRRRLLDLVKENRDLAKKFVDMKTYAEHLELKLSPQPKMERFAERTAVADGKDFLQRLSIEIDRSVLEAASALDPEKIMKDAVAKFETENPTLEVLCVEATSRSMSGDFILRLRCRKRPA